jgi:hypothetical protein
MARTTKEVFEDHLQKRREGDLEGDIQTNYHPDVVFLTGTGTFHGHDGVRQSAAELERYLGGNDFEFKTKLVEGEYAFLEWNGFNNEKTVHDGADSFVIRDGKIVMQSIHYCVQRD